MFSWVFGLLTSSSDGESGGQPSNGLDQVEDDWELVEHGDLLIEPPATPKVDVDLTKENLLIERPFLCQLQEEEVDEEDSNGDTAVEERRSSVTPEETRTTLPKRNTTTITQKQDKYGYNATATPITVNHHPVKSERMRKLDKRRSSKQDYRRNSRVCNDRRCGNRGW